MNPAERLAAEAIAMRELHANVIDATNIGTYAIERGIRNWPVFPGNGKIPAIPNPHPEGSIERQTCKGECGLDGHGVLDATIDVEKIGFWWGGKYAGCNILGRVPESMFVVDVDPRHDGARSIAALEERYGLLPETLMTVSGRMDGGVH
jgi:Bifunctional DNA primase/polymerase, N-terminal